jgi:hypothetical protein
VSRAVPVCRVPTGSRPLTEPPEQPAATSGLGASAIAGRAPAAMFAMLVVVRVAVPVAVPVTVLVVALAS